MKSYIFISKEGFTYQPNSESIDPDIENCQVIGFSTGIDPNDAFRNFIENNECIRKTSFNEIYSLELKSGGKEAYFSLDEYR